MPTYSIKVTQVSRTGFVTSATFEADAPSEKVAVDTFKQRYSLSHVECLGELVEIKEPDNSWYEKGEWPPVGTDLWLVLS